MFNQKAIRYQAGRKFLTFVVGIVVMAVLVSACIAPSPGVSYRVTTDTPFYTGGIAQGYPPETLVADSEVLVIENQGNYIRVRVEDGREGIIPIGSIGPLVTAASPIPANQFTHQVTTDTEYYKDGPQQARPADGTLTVGTKVVVLQEAGSYVLVRTADGIEAYIATDSIAPLMPPTLPEQEAWRSPELRNSWQNYGGGFNPAGFFKDTQGIVHLRGLVKNVTANANDTTIFALPPGYLPPNQELHFVISGEAVNQGAVGRVDIDTAGKVQFVYGDSALVSLDGITFRAK